MRKACLIILCIICETIAYAQQSYNRKILKYSSKDGLSYGFVTGIVQDDNGFIWFATEDGLNRFDGINFKVFKHNASNPNSLPSNYLDFLYKDAEGDIWLSTRQGIYQFDTNTEKYVKFKQAANILVNDLTSITAVKNTVWFSTYTRGVFSYNKTTGIFKNFNLKNIEPAISNSSTYVYQDSKGLLWVGAETTTSVFNTKGGQVKKSLNNQMPLNQVPAGRVNAITEDEFSNIWIATNKGLAVYKRAQNKILVFEGPRYQMRSNNFSSLLQDNDHNLLIGLQDGGLYRLDLQKANQTDFENVSIQPVKTDDNFTVTERTVFRLYMDKDKNVWAGTYGDGVYLLGNVPGIFKKFQNKLRDANSTGYLRYYGMCMDDEGYLWLGTDGDGIYKKKLNGEVIQHYFADVPGAPLKNVAILAAYKSRSNDLWFGSYAHGLFKYDKKTGNFTNWTHNASDPSSLCRNDVRTIFEDLDDNIWLGTNNGGISVLPKNGTKFINYSTANNALPGNNIRAICEDNTGKIYVGTYGNGLLCFDKQQHKFSACFSSSQLAAFLPSKVIYSLKCFGSKLMIGTESNGLIIYDLESKGIKRFMESDGLANNTINAIQRDSKGNIWVSTNKGLSKIENKTGSILNYDVSNGLQAGHFSPSSSMYSARDNFICFGGTEGYNIFFPDDVKRSNFKPKVLITGLQLFNKDVEVGEKDHILSKTINKADEIVLKPDQSVFSVQYVALNYPYSDKSEFAYRLVGLDKNWNYVKTQKSATYRYLEPGTYVFKVKASNQDGVWFDDYAAINIRILPPWYKTWYAWLFYVLFAIAMVYYYLRYKNNQSKLKYDIRLAHITAEQEKELNEKKLSFFTNISHEYRTPLTLIINPLKQLLADKENSPGDTNALKVVYRNAKRLLSLTDQLLLFRKADSGGDKLTIVKLNIVELCKEVILYFDFQVKTKNLQIEFNSDNAVIEVYADRGKIEIVVFNLISNAIKFTPDNGKISCGIIEDRDSVTIRIKDSGYGISKEIGEKLFDRFFQIQNISQSHGGGFGIGLYLVKTFIDNHQGRIGYESEEANGSTFSVTLLKGKKHFGDNLIFEDTTEPSIFLDELMDEEGLITESEYLNQVPADAYNALVSSKKVLLIIEDNPEVRQYIVQIFSYEYHVFEADNASDGYSMICELMPSLVISDVMMNGFSGIELCSRVKEDSALSHIPFILLTANALPEIKLKGIECGADDYITKPFEKEVLVARVNGLIKSHENLHKYFYNAITLKSNGHKIPAEYKEFLEKCIAIVENHLEDEQFSIKNLSDEIGMSHSNLYKKIKAISGRSANEFIRYIRLRKAAELMLNSDVTVAEAAYKVGINNAKYFREQFSKLFGMNPSEYIKKHRGQFSPAGKRFVTKL
ncbi:two-component regulator propeller domain-containing protein [Mucilaginibacter sp.]|uniref:hybrid sensor histidine kinase/response regulator transcription factor n=1 Tax=Mucilaginibacter sp. TaxID=1882438 RepID=UPI0025D7C4EC|nr:two-component regulator propeller domain-containing protein [Mucilaginibacter sp.]